MKNNSPFKAFIKNNFPFIENTLDALTEYQILCKCIEEIDKLIVKYSVIDGDIATLKHNLSSLKNYVENYFNSLNIQNEINTGLNILVENGVIAELINNVVFENLSTRVTNIFDKIYNDKFSMTFVESTDNNLIGLSVIMQNKDKTAIYDFTNQRTATTLLNTLKKLNVKNIDYLFISHIHEDHIAGLDALLNNTSGITFNNCSCVIGGGAINWSKWKGNKGLNYSELLNSIITSLNTKGINVLLPDTENTIYNFGSAKIYAFNVSEILFNNYYDETETETLVKSSETNLNNFSMCLRIEHNNKVYCLSGDIMPKAQSLIYHNFIGVDVLQIEHHGLNYMSDDNYLNSISPEFSIISAYYRTYKDYVNNIKLTAQKCLKSGILLDTLYSGSITIYDDISGINVDFTNIEKPYPTNYNTLFSPKDLRSGDFNNLAIGDYTVYSNTNLKNIQNNPSGINGGGRVFNIKTTNTSGETQIYLTAYTLHNTIAIRQKTERSSGAIEWGKWKYIVPSVKYYKTISTSDFNKSVSITSGFNRITAQNGFLTISLDFKPTVQIDANSVLITIDKELNYNAKSIIILANINGSSFPFSVTSADGKTEIKTLRPLTTNDRILGTATIDLFPSLDIDLNE